MNNSTQAFMNLSKQIRTIESAVQELKFQNTQINFVKNKKAGMFLDNDKLAEGIKIDEKIDQLNVLLDNIREIHFDNSFVVSK